MKIIKRLLVSERGAVLPFVGLAFLVLVAAVGLAVDYGRAQMVQSKLHAGLDAAGLAAASVAKSRNIETEVLKFMEANFPQGYMGANPSSNKSYPNSYVTKIKVTTDDDNNISIDLDGEADVDTIFMRIFGFDKVPVTANTVISQNRGGFELVMVFDNSTSMQNNSEGGVTRRVAMVNAADEMLDDIYGASSSFDNVFIGMVPFTHKVNIDDAKRDSSNWLRAAPNSNTAIKGKVRCFYDGDSERAVRYAVTDTPPTAASPSALYYGAEMNKDCDVQEVLPMQNTKKEINKALDKMRKSKSKGIAGGSTRIDLGTIWAWRMLSPRWKGYWNHSDGKLPLSYGTKGMEKVMIILTDGNNTVADYTGLAKSVPDTRLREACAKIKAEGIIVYTITFHERRNEALMRSCATSPDYYFHASGNNSIGRVFQQIGDSLSNLRISK